MKSIVCILSIFIVGVYAILDDSCSSLWKRWQPCSGGPSPYVAGYRTIRCIVDGRQVIVLALSTLNGVTLHCQGESPDPKVTSCLNITAFSTLGMLNCNYSEFILGDYVRDKATVDILIRFDLYSDYLVNPKLVISDIPTLRNVTIFGLRSIGLFDVKFGNLPNIYLLNITTHNFTRFHNRPFRSLKSLQGLSLRLGIIEVIPEDLFDGLENLQLLDLSLNRIKKFPPNVFNQLIHLTDLDLGGNHIEQLSSDLFINLATLATLRIPNNRLTALPPNLLQHIPTLILLDISGNVLVDNIPDGFLSSASQLQKLVAINCSLTNLSETLFSHSRYFTYVALMLNHLKSLPPGIFKNNENLIYLFLDFNEFSYFSPGTFHPLFRLRMLWIMYNKLRSLDGGIFSGLSSLSDLNLSNNKIVSINESAFDPLVNLQKLDISNNPLLILPFRYPFGKSRFLSIIVASNCWLQEMPNVNWMMGNLTYVDFSNNLISDVTLPVFTRNRTQVLLLNNNISSITLDFTDRSNVSPFYFVSNNPVLCDCNLQEFLQFLHSDIQKNNLVFVDVRGMACYGSETESLFSIWPPYKSCPLESEDCPTKCHCYMTIQKKAVIECFNNELVTAPSIIPPESTVLYLQNNNITELPLNTTNSWRNIEELYLSNNSLESLEDWPIPPKLSLLAIDGNLLTNLPTKLMIMVDKVPYFRLYLANNSWKCDCDLVIFKGWFDRNKRKIRDSNNTFCTRVSQENGTELASLIIDTPIDLFCLERTASPAWQAATITVAVVVLLFIVLAITYYRYNNTILSILYSRNIYCFWWERKDSEDKLFDAFLCYNSNDREVVMEIINELEPTYKLCIHERDWLPGFAISHHIVNSVQNSRKTLLLISKHFLESIWFQVEFRTAYSQMMEDRIHTLVLIILGDIGDTSNLEEDLRHLLSTKTYLKWGEKWFWEKLRYALRHSRKQTGH